MPDFIGENLTGSRFEDVYLTGARFHDVDLSNARFRFVDMTGVVIRGAGLKEPESFAVRRCLGAVLTEEWEHRLYAERDLDVLESGAS